MPIILVALLATCLATPARSAQITLLLPSAPFGLAGDQELGAIVDRYNRERAHGEDERVSLVRRGEEFSTLREFMARHLAGDAPAIAALEASELPALGKVASTLVPPPERLRKRAAALEPAGSAARADRLLPFQRTLPVLVTSDQGPFPRTWAELVASTQGKPGALALPLQGPRGLWLFEALAGKPLWLREPGGLRANRGLGPSVAALQKLVTPEQSWEQSLSAFLERKSPLLITSLDALPALARQATFRWSAGPVPRMEAAAGPSGPALLQAGNGLAVTRDSPAVWKFLDYLYSSEVAGRWSAASGFLPPSSEALASPAWKKAPGDLHKVAQRLMESRKSGFPLRSADEDVLRARSEWIQALHLLYGEPARRMPLEDVLTQLDSRLSRSH
jgi:hypothetical protein